MGRLAVILGSNALGPGGEQIAAAAAEHGAAIVQRHSGDALRPPPPDRPRGEPAAAGRAGLRPRPGDLLGRLAAGRAAESAASSAPTTSSPSHLRRSIFADARAHTAPGFDPRWRRRGDRGLGGGRPGAARRRRLLADDRAALRDPGRDAADRRPCRRGRDDVASECVVAGELGLQYAALCMVDNLANGLGPETLSVAELEVDRTANAAAPARRPRRGAAAARGGGP